MGIESDIVCFTCGKPTGEEPHFNTLSTGELCPACRDRVLEALAPALPTGRQRDAEPPPVQGELFATGSPLSPRDEFDDDGPIGA